MTTTAMDTARPTGANRGGRGTAALAACAALALTGLTFAHSEPGPATGGVALEARHYDARATLRTPQGFARTPASADAVRSLVASMPDLRAEVEPSTGATRSLWNPSGFLTPADARDPKAIAEEYMHRQAAALGLVASDLDDVELTDAVTSPITGATHLYYRQRLQGIPVYNAQLQFNIASDGRIVSVNNGFLPELASAVSSMAPSLEAPAAVSFVARHLGLADSGAVTRLPVQGVRRTTTMTAAGVSTEPIEASLMVLPIRRGEARLVWNLQVRTLDDAHAFDFTVDAETGQVWTRVDWAAGDQYRVYPRPVESPDQSSPAAPLDGRVVVSDPADLTASPFGWHDTDGVAGAESTATAGNNASVFIDANGDGAPDEAAPDCGVGLDCDFPLDLTAPPSTHRPASLANLFYWTNLVHDIQYRYGFDEPSGNFQQNNYGRGGAGGDALQAAAGRSVDGSSFVTPPDGSAPRMTLSLSKGPILLTVNSPAGVAGSYASLGASFGPSLGEMAPITAEAVPVGLACAAIATLPAGSIALVDRGTCAFVIKALNVQAAGAVAMIVVNNAGTTPVAMGGADPSITIPSASISLPDGNLWKANPPVNVTLSAQRDHDAALDAGTIVHEYAHGIANRLIGGPANTGCLANAQQPGEGISDWFSLVYTARPADTGAQPRSVGTYPAFSLPTVAGPNRQLPYSTDGAVNTWTYASAAGQVTAYGVGTVWTQAMWEAYWALVDQHGFGDIADAAGSAGNQRALLYHTEGLRYTSCSPGLTQLRDGIIQAAQMTHGGEDVCRLWTAFAAFGLGTDAQNPSVNSTEGLVDGFDVPLACGGNGNPSISIDDVTVTEGSGPSTATFTVTRSSPSATESRVSFTATAGTASASVTTVAGAAVSFSGAAQAQPYPVTVDVAGLSGVVTDLTISLTSVALGVADALDLLLVGPGGQQVMLMSDVGGAQTADSSDLTFVRRARPLTVLPRLTAGRWAPTDADPGDTFPAPAPSGPYTTDLSVFDGTDPNGAWRLYGVTDTPSGGWISGVTLQIATSGQGDFAPVAGELVFPPYSTSQTIAVPIHGDAVVEPNETFTVVLSDPHNAALTDAVGVGTIADDDAMPPTSVGDSVATPFWTTLTVAAPGVLANDVTNAGPMTAVLVSSPARGALTWHGDGGFIYDPNPGFFGLDSFTYRAANAAGAGTLATVQITVAPGPPTAFPDSYGVPYATTLDVAAPGVLVNDVGNGSGPLTVELVAGATHGLLTLAADGRLTYTPAFGFAGDDTFTYRVRAGATIGSEATVLVSVSEPLVVQPPYDLRVDSVHGNTVTLRWDTVAAGPQATEFVLEGGVAPGQVLASVPTGSGAPLFTFEAPTGSFHVRVRGRTAIDTSAPSNEVPLHVNVPVTPSPPSHLAGTANGASVELSWRHTFGGGEPTDTLLDVTGTVSASIPLGPAEAFSYPSMPAGSYTFRVRDANDAGASPPSSPVTLAFPAGCSGVPQPPEHVLAYSQGNTLFVLWDPPASGTAATSYVLHVSGAYTGSFPMATRRLSSPVPPGIYSLSVAAVNTCGASASSVPQTVTVP